MSRLTPRRTAVAAVVALAAASGGGLASAEEPASFIVDTGTDSTDAAPGDGQCADDMGRCSLRAAVQESNALGGAHVTLPTGTYAISIANAAGDEESAATGDLDVTAALTLNAHGATVDGSGIDRIFEVMAGATFSLAGGTLTGGSVAGGANPIVGSGGAIANAGTTTLSGVIASGNSATGPLASGGAILNTGTFSADASTFVGNTATRAGGGIEANGGTTVITASTLSDNESGDGPGNGGALHLSGAGEVRVVDSYLSGNVATEGAGVWNSATGTMIVSGSTFVGNIADGAAADQGGGALFNDGGTLTVLDSSLVDNHAVGTAGSGGAILNDRGSLNVVRVTIDGNTAKRAGGGIESNVGTTTIESVQLVGNRTGSSPGNGGGFHITGAGNATVVDSVVTRNWAAAEGGGLWNGTGTMIVRNSQISKNVASGAGADQGGGGLFNAGGTLVVEGSHVSANIADGASGSGGGILNDQGTLRLSTSNLSRNEAKRAGGGVEANVGVTELDDVRLEDNHTGSAPGNGGGLHLTGAGTVSIEGGRIFRNTATKEGGGIWNSSTGTMTVTGTEIRKNSAPVGADVFTQPGGTLIVQP